MVLKRLWRLGLILAIALGSFLVALGRFSDAAEQSCMQRVTVDPSYEVQWDRQPSTDVSNYRIRVTRAGVPVTGARVCVSAYMVGMSAMAVADIGREVEPGVYELRLTFEMGQEWAGQVMIDEDGRLAGVPLKLDVEDRWGMSPAS